jgi:hypothetical protein
VPAQARHGEPADEWTVVLTSSGGIAGRISRLEVRSTGDMERREKDAIVCSDRIAPDALAAVQAAVASGRPETWRKRYPAHGPKGGADGIVSTLTLTRTRGKASSDETTVEWDEGESRLPQDLLEIVKALSAVDPGTTGCTK